MNLNLGTKLSSKALQKFIIQHINNSKTKLKPLHRGKKIPPLKTCNSTNQTMFKAQIAKG